ncbi:MAG: hypothetical protein F6K30_25455 [Cyanothece sp. SIO2G6]|nr:hypothetical protein [Cyanothece sp. SIO2G6]
MFVSFCITLHYQVCPDEYDRIQRQGTVGWWFPSVIPSLALYVQTLTILVTISTLFEKNILLGDRPHLASTPHFPVGGQFDDW